MRKLPVKALNYLKDVFHNHENDFYYAINGGYYHVSWYDNDTSISVKISHCGDPPETKVMMFAPYKTSTGITSYEYKFPEELIEAATRIYEKTEKQHHDQKKKEAAKEDKIKLSILLNLIGEKYE